MKTIKFLLLISLVGLLTFCKNKDNPSPISPKKACIDKNALMGRSFNYIDSPSPPASATLDFVNDTMKLSYTMNSQPAGMYKWKVVFKSNNDSMYVYTSGTANPPMKYKIQVLSCDSMRITNSTNSYRLVTNK